MRSNTTLDQYEIVDEIARGDSTTIFRACDVGTGRPVALKVPHPHLESDVAFHERFSREEEIGQRLSHPAVVKVLSPRIKSCVYFAMEYVEGAPLRVAPHTPVAVALALGVEIADALAYLHANGVLHRDLQPAHIMVRPDGHIKLIGLGHADYGRDARTDIASLGALLHKMLSGDDIPANVEKIVMRALRNRIRTAAELRERLADSV